MRSDPAGRSARSSGEPLPRGMEECIAVLFLYCYCYSAGECVVPFFGRSPSRVYFPISGGITALEYLLSFRARRSLTLGIPRAAEAVLRCTWIHRRSVCIREHASSAEASDLCDALYEHGVTRSRGVAREYK